MSNVQNWGLTPANSYGRLGVLAGPGGSRSGEVQMTRTENALFTVRLTTRQIAAVQRAVVELIRDTEWAEVFGEGEEVATLREALRILNEEAVSILSESKSSD